MIAEGTRVVDVVNPKRVGTVRYIVDDAKHLTVRWDNGDIDNIEVSRVREVVHYVGRRTEDGCFVTRGLTGAPIPQRIDVFNHSPTGHEWGYGGSGPAQLALDMLLDVSEDDDQIRELASRVFNTKPFFNDVMDPVEQAAIRCHQSFKFQHVARWDRGGFTIPMHEVRAWFVTALRSAAP